MPCCDRENSLQFHLSVLGIIEPVPVSCKIEKKAMIRNRYNYPTSHIRDIKGKETQTRNNWILMETSLLESQTDSYFPTKWPNGYPKQKDVSDTHMQRRTITKINHDRRTALEWSVKNIISLGGGGEGGELKSLLFHWVGRRGGGA